MYVACEWRPESLRWRAREVVATVAGIRSERSTHGETRFA
jgi:hypothetical protein